ncbi:hypothetical protein [Paenibacillus ferrarius]|uniref:hypothetical protein n=1 Tax=Paenibacillus ferrarius TaxID=1469647 RepID=UPI003D28DDB3
MKWKQELLWVKRNEQGIVLRVEEEKPVGVPADQFEEVSASEKFEIFASLHRYFELARTSKPTVRHAEEAVNLLCRLFGVLDEEELLKRNDPELIKTYTHLKNEIMMKVNEYM